MPVAREPNRELVTRVVMTTRTRLGAPTKDAGARGNGVLQPFPAPAEVAECQPGGISRDCCVLVHVPASHARLVAGQPFDCTIFFADLQLGESQLEF
jgi:hypothetical protein